MVGGARARSWTDAAKTTGNGDRVVNAPSSVQVAASSSSAYCYSVSSRPPVRRARRWLAFRTAAALHLRTRGPPLNGRGTTSGAAARPPPRCKFGRCMRRAPQLSFMRTRPRIERGWSVRSSSDSSVFIQAARRAEKVPWAACERSVRRSATGSAPSCRASGSTLASSPPSASTRASSATTCRQRGRQLPPASAHSMAPCGGLMPSSNPWLGSNPSCFQPLWMPMSAPEGNARSPAPAGATARHARLICGARLPTAARR